MRLLRYLQSIQKDASGVLGIANAMSQVREHKNLVDIQDIVMDDEL